MINLFQLWEMEENKIIKFDLLILTIAVISAGSIMIVMSFDAIVVYGDKFIGLTIFLFGVIFSTLPSVKMYPLENSKYPTGWMNYTREIIKENLL